MSAAVVGVAPLEEYLPVERITVSLEASEAAVNSGSWTRIAVTGPSGPLCDGLELAGG